MVIYFLGIFMKMSKVNDEQLYSWYNYNTRYGKADILVLDNVWCHTHSEPHFFAPFAELQG